MICFSDVLTPGIWNEVAVLEDPSLRTLVPDLLYFLIGSRASSSVSKYKSGWLRWRAWASSKIGVSVVPAKRLHIAFFFITELTNKQLPYEQYGCILCRSLCEWH